MAYLSSPIIVLDSSLVSDENRLLSLLDKSGLLSKNSISNTQQISLGDFILNFQEVQEFLITEGYGDYLISILLANNRALIAKKITLPPRVVYPPTNILGYMTDLFMEELKNLKPEFLEEKTKSEEIEKIEEK
jgi:hypothetical protein